MSNPVTPGTPGTPIPPAGPTPPSSGGGMPKWLIILLVVLIVVVVGCCGGFAACRFACHRVGNAVVNYAEAKTQRMAENGVTIGGGSGQPSVTIGGTKLPANFPKDVPVMSGLTSTGVTVWDSAKGSGMVMLSGSASRQDVAAYYTKQMKDEGWTQEQNVELGDNTTMTFNKEKRMTLVQVMMDNGKTNVSIHCDTKP